ncbi:MAG TPA: aminoglycoside phosphotransferase family protein [Longimicrobiales bacterium]|nr:aminoglycoside phosphotransferase family protein [Longimicrobiales bacterium]
MSRGRDRAGGERRATIADRITFATDRSGRHVVVKLEPDAAARDAEIRALRHWDGRGAARVLDVDEAHGAIVLERVVPGTSLREEAVPDPGAAAIAAGVIRTLHAAAPPLPALPRIGEWLTYLDAPKRALAEDLCRRSSGEVVLHGDLHHDNILHAGMGDWLAIDPKGVIGPREAEPASFLRNPRDELLASADPVGLSRARARVMARVLDQDPSLLLGWACVLGGVAAAWAAEDGEGPGR